VPYEGEHGSSGGGLQATTTRKIYVEKHRRRSSVNFRGQDIYARKICIKINKMPEFYMILARKILSKYPKFYYTCPKNSQYSRILHDFVRKMPEFYIIIAREIFFPNFRGHVPPAPVSYPMNVHRRKAEQRQTRTATESHV